MDEDDIVYALTEQQGYEKLCIERGRTLEQRKTWFWKMAMTNFLLAVPKKLGEGKLIARACQVSERYLELELSNAVSVAE